MNDKTELGAAEGAEAIFALVEDIAEASADGDLARLETIIDKMQLIAAESGVEMPAIAQKIASLKGQSSRAKKHFENTDAALWAGDLKRAERLTFQGPGLDFAALEVAAGNAVNDGMIDYSDDIDLEEGIDPDFDLSDFAAGLGVDIDMAALEVDPGADDEFASIAAGEDGAIEAAIEARVDLNAPSGPSQHTALLAALDAPKRAADKIKRLLEAGADARVVHVQGDNALSWAMGYHHLETVTAESEAALIACLVEHGANANHSVSGQLTALQRGILQAEVPQVQALLIAGADHAMPMAADFEPKKLASATAVMLAAAKPETLSVLLDHGADAETPDALGRTALEFVRLEAEAARNRVDIDDEWTVDHAEALEISLGLLERHLEP